MSLNKIKQAKENKYFKKADLIIYSLILFVVVGLFLGVFLGKNNDEVQFVEFKQNGQIKLVYNFEDNSYELKDNSGTIHLEEKGDNLIVTIYEDDKKDHFNKINIDKKNRVVTVQESNCSSSKDCKKMSIKKCGDTIICVPHNLIIQTNTKAIKDPTIG